MSLLRHLANVKRTRTNLVSFYIESDAVQPGDDHCRPREAPPPPFRDALFEVEGLAWIPT